MGRGVQAGEGLGRRVGHGAPGVPTAVAACSSQGPLERCWGRGGQAPPLTPVPSRVSPLPRVSLQKAGGGLRQWKRVYAALRARSLSLSKERREPGPAAAAGAAAAVAGEDEAAPVCIGSCLVDISYSETKRRHVFRLTTADFCEYLFQAEDRDDMLGWIRAIRENSRAEGEVRARPPTRAREEGRGGREAPGPPLTSRGPPSTALSLSFLVPKMG